MKGLFVVLLCATVGYCVKASPVTPEVDSSVESSNFREAKDLPVPGRFHGGFINPQAKVNPFLQETQQHHEHQVASGVQISGRSYDQRTKVLPVDSNVRTADTITSKNAAVNVIEDTMHEKPVEIVSQNSDIYPDGSHFNVWESANGIKVQEEGMVKVNGDVAIPSVSGSVSYTDPDGTPIHLTYIADENGYQPQGDHLPTPPPIPQSVLRTLQYIADHPWVEEDHVKTPSKVSSVKEELPIVEVA